MPELNSEQFQEVLHQAKEPRRSLGQKIAGKLLDVMQTKEGFR